MVARITAQQPAYRTRIVDFADTIFEDYDVETVLADKTWTMQLLMKLIHAAIELTAIEPLSDSALQLAALRATATLNVDQRQGGVFFGQFNKIAEFTLLDRDPN